MLEDLRDVFGNAGHLFTVDILDRLNSIEEAPWGDLYGKPMDARGLANRLRKFEISSKSVRISEETAKGYSREDLWDAWQRYLPGDVTAGEANLAKNDSIQLEDGAPSPGATPNRSVTSVTSDTESYAEALDLLDFDGETDRIAL